MLEAALVLAVRLQSPAGKFKTSCIQPKGQDDIVSREMFRPKDNSVYT